MMLIIFICLTLLMGTYVLKALKRIRDDRRRNEEREKRWNEYVSGKEHGE